MSRWFGIPFGVPMSTESAHPEWLPQTAASDDARDLGAKREDDITAARWADLGDWLSVIFGWVDDEERWATTEAHIDSVLRLQP